MQNINILTILIIIITIIITPRPKKCCLTRRIVFSKLHGALYSDARTVQRLRPDLAVDRRRCRPGGPSAENQGGAVHAGGGGGAAAR